MWQICNLLAQIHAQTDCTLMCRQERSYIFYMVTKHKELAELRYPNATYARPNQRAPLNKYIQLKETWDRSYQKDF